MKPKPIDLLINPAWHLPPEAWRVYGCPHDPMWLWPTPERKP